MKYSLAVIALLGLTSTVDGVKIQSHHHHKHHHHDQSLVGLAGDKDAAPVEKKAAAPVEKKAAAAKEEPAKAEAKPSADLPPENKANATFRVE